MPPDKEAPFLASVADTGAVIEQLRGELDAIDRQRAALDEKANNLKVRIAAFENLRQAHGLPPV